MTNNSNNAYLSFLDDNRTVNDHQNNNQTQSKKNTQSINPALQYANEILANLISLGCINQSEAKSRGPGETDQSEGDLRTPL